MSRLGPVFQRLRDEGRRAVIPYLVAGDPNEGLTVPLMHSLVEAGADVIEVGVPFSDPMSEGPTIQKGHERALAGGTSLNSTLALIAEFRLTDLETPLILMGYANPLERKGYAAVADACAEAGIDGLITVDLPPEEVAVMNTELQRHSIDNIFLISPTTTEDRIITITEQASGFIYYVALKGVTGAGHLDTEAVEAHLAIIRQYTDLPVAVGFGIKDAQTAARVAVCADAVVVGSALVDEIAADFSEHQDDARAIAIGGSLISSIRKGVNLATSN
ncbi:tryptophan synthase subunit alpha [Luminiphilus sp.]|nr:tryptophan synthase subunit alpha [Luminiphilus sp.]MDA8738446.1 tryptophan synthase subunit alpha [Luminiphilus sp.]MDB2313640.1 tryptophan synthase subunit alpha [Luminiphilus sp.]MDB2659622.1 tryptophan synthase subunit alpha [Luminiphilus sp.]MDB2667758.1 tryptophan synthase subunit alpha [Luminiphilus sp.]